MSNHTNDRTSRSPMIQEVSSKQKKETEKEKVQSAMKRMIHFDDESAEHVEVGESEVKEVVPPSATATLYMYLQAEILSKSTQMSKFSAQLQQFQQEIQERQNAVNDVKSKMLNLQGALGILQSTSQKMRELEIIPSSDT